MSYMFAQKSTATAPEHVKYADRLRGVGGKAFKSGTHNAISNKATELFGFKASEQKNIVGGHYQLITSSKYPEVIMVSYKMFKRAGEDGHRVVFIKRDSGIEFYNPNGENYTDLPANLRAHLHTELGVKDSIKGVEGSITPELSTIVDHQGAFPVCSDCSLIRAVHWKEGNAGLYGGEQGETSARKIISAVKNTADKGVIKKDEPPVSAEYKKGGIVKGKKGKAVSIVAHAGELVVPAEAVPKILKSSAWIDHIKAVQKAHGISYKEAMKVAKNTYNK